MYALILFDDGIYYICKQADIKKKGNECIVRYKGSRYAGTVVAVNVERKQLSTLKSKLEAEQAEIGSDSEHDEAGENKLSINGQSPTLAVSKLAGGRRTLNENTQTNVITNLPGEGKKSKDLKEENEMEKENSMPKKNKEQKNTKKKERMKEIGGKNCEEIESSNTTDSLAVSVSEAEFSIEITGTGEASLFQNLKEKDKQPVVEPEAATLITESLADERSETLKSEKRRLNTEGGSLQEDDDTRDPAPDDQSNAERRCQKKDIPLNAKLEDKCRLSKNEIVEKKQLSTLKSNLEAERVEIGSDFEHGEGDENMLPMNGQSPMLAVSELAGGRRTLNENIKINVIASLPGEGKKRKDLKKEENEMKKENSMPKENEEQKNAEKEERMKEIGGKNCEEIESSNTTDSPAVSVSEAELSMEITGEASLFQNLKQQDKQPVVEPEAATPITEYLADERSETLKSEEKQLNTEGGSLQEDDDTGDPAPDDQSNAERRFQKNDIALNSKIENERRLSENGIVTEQSNSESILASDASNVASIYSPLDEHKKKRKPQIVLSENLDKSKRLCLEKLRTNGEKRFVMNDHAKLDNHANSSERNFLSLPITAHTLTDELAALNPADLDASSKDTSILLSLPLGVTLDDDGLFAALNDEDNWIWEGNTLNVCASEVTVDNQSDNVEPNSFSCSAGIQDCPSTSTVANADNGEAEDDADLNASDCSSASNYVPEANTSDESDESEGGEKAINYSKQELTQSNNASTDLDASLAVNKVGHSAPDDNEMFVKTVESGIKKDFCVYCHTEQGKLSRHVVRRHKNEEDVAKFLSFTKASDERKLIMGKIRKAGQFCFNTNRAFNTGERKVTRRPNERYHLTARDFVTCPSCAADYRKGSSFRRHYRRCQMKKPKKRRGVLQNSKQLVGRIHPQASDILRRKVFPTLQEDEVVMAIRYDELAILFGNKLCLKYKSPHHYDMIRQRLRQIGRFLIAIRKESNDIHDLFSIFYPKHYDAAIATVQKLAGINEAGTGFAVPSIATSAGTLLKQIGKLCVSVWIKRQDKEKQTYVEDFLKLLIEDYTTSISRTALETQARQKRLAKTVLPSNGDIHKLQAYLAKTVKKNYEKLNENFSKSAWLELAEATLVSVQLFNRRRAGEMERIFIEDFLCHEKIDESTIGVAFNSFTPDEKQAATKYSRFTIRGKLNRTVAVLLHRELVGCCELLLRHRSKAGVNKKNPYLFGIPGTLKGDYKYLRACDLMRRFAMDCGAEKPLLLRGTILRKHVATMCVHFNLSEGEVSDLANFMGHAEKIHKEHYRQPIISREILQISKLLETVQGQDDASDTDDENELDKAGPSSQETATAPEVENKTMDSFIGLHPEAADVENKEGDTSDEEMVKKPKEKKKRSTSPFGKVRRVRWSQRENSVAQRAFNACIAKKVLPSFAEIQQVIDANPGVFNRNIASIKTWVSNQIKKK